MDKQEEVKTIFLTGDRLQQALQISNTMMMALGMSNDYPWEPLAAMYIVLEFMKHHEGLVITHSEAVFDRDSQDVPFITLQLTRTKLPENVIRWEDIRRGE